MGILELLFSYSMPPWTGRACRKKGREGIKIRIDI